ncbi:MAG: alpha/beta fold hydrolase [Clostridium sp.]
MEGVFEGKIKVFDIKLHYYEKGNGLNVVVFHGNGMNTVSFKKLFLELSKRYHVIGIDTRGHGKSEIGKKVLSIEQFADDFMKFFEVKNIKEPSIIGFSDGANIGMMMCKKYGKYINKVVLISGNYNEDGLKTWGRILIKGYISILKILGTCIKKMSKEAKIAKVMLGSIGVDESDLNKIKNEILVLAASNDVIKLNHSLNIKKAIKNAKFIEVKKSNHLNIINKDETIREIKMFLKDERKVN